MTGYFFIAHNCEHIHWTGGPDWGPVILATDFKSASGRSILLFCVGRRVSCPCSALQHSSTKPMNLRMPSFRTHHASTGQTVGSLSSIYALTCSRCFANHPKADPSEIHLVWPTSVGHIDGHVDLISDCNMFCRRRSEITETKETLKHSFMAYVMTA